MGRSCAAVDGPKSSDTFFTPLCLYGGGDQEEARDSDELIDGLLFVSLEADISFPCVLFLETGEIGFDLIIYVPAAFRVERVFRVALCNGADYKFQIPPTTARCFPFFFFDYYRGR
jgi:hypothetical protein